MAALEKSVIGRFAELVAERINRIRSDVTLKKTIKLAKILSKNSKLVSEASKIATIISGQSDEDKDLIIKEARKLRRMWRKN